MMMMVVVVVALSFRIWLLIGDLSSWKICFVSFGFDLGFLEIEKRKIVAYIFILLKEKSRLN